MEDLHEALAGRIFVHPVTQLEISSTDLRDLIVAGRDPRYLVPDAVRDDHPRDWLLSHRPTR